MPTLDRINDQPADKPKRPYAPYCGRCEDRGYLNCPEARAPDGGDYIAIAFQRATSCNCVYGAQFAENQEAWNR
jgi:hypothetical protein